MLLYTTSKSVRDLLLPACCSACPALLCSIAITTALFTAFCRGGDGGKSKIYAEITQRVVSSTQPSPDQLSSAAKIPIGNGLETVCGAGEMRRDKLPVRGKIVYGLQIRLKRIPELPHTHGCTKPVEHINHLSHIHSSDS